MTIKVWKDGKVVGKSRNLRGVTAYARKSEVSDAHVYKNHKGGAYLHIRYRDGATVLAEFRSFVVAVDWLKARRWGLKQYGNDPYGGPMFRYTLTPVKDVPNYAVIIRCVHERGFEQEAALIELRRRGLWLSDEQKITAGLEQVECK